MPLDRVCLDRTFVVLLDFSEIVHVAASDALAPIVGIVFPMSRTSNACIVSGQVRIVILRALKTDGIEIFKGGEEELRSIASVGSQLFQFKLFRQVACTGVERAFGLSLRDITVLVQRWVQFAGQINWVLNPWSVRLIGAVRNECGNNISSERLLMNVRRQIFHTGIEPRPFSTFITTTEYVLSNREFLVVVDDGLTIKCIAVFFRVKG